MENLHPYGVGRLHVRRRITPEQREDGNALLQTHGHVVLDREVQKQIHTERLIGERPNPMDFLAEERWRRELRLQDAEAARVAHRGDGLWPSQIRSHRCGDDRIFDPEHVAERGFHRHLHRIRPHEAGTDGSRAHRFRSCELRCWAGKFVSNLLLIAITFSPVKPSPAARSEIAVKQWSCPPGRLQSRRHAVVSPTFLKRCRTLRGMNTMVPAPATVVWPSTV